MCNAAEHSAAMLGFPEPDGGDVPLVTQGPIACGLSDATLSAWRHDQTACRRDGRARRCSARDVLGGWPMMRLKARLNEASES